MLALEDSITEKPSYSFVLNSLLKLMKEIDPPILQMKKPVQRGLETWQSHSRSEPKSPGFQHSALFAKYKIRIGQHPSTVGLGGFPGGLPQFHSALCPGP